MTEHLPPAARKARSGSLVGKVVAITGGAQGIGFATAVACAAAGMSVAIGDLSASASAQAAEELGIDRAIGLPVDVRNRESFSAFLDATAEQLGEIDIVINNAGVLHMGPFAESEPDEVQRQVDVNLGGVLIGSRLALDRFLPRGSGHIVNMASTAAMVAAPNGAVYTATKYAVLGFTRALRGELRGSGIRTTVVMPGVIRTEMTTDFRGATGVRVIEPDAVAEAIVAAIRTGAMEVCVPKEVALQGRLFTTLPAGLSDMLRRITGADQVMH
ncbi:SDR family NAD(P)-dependent oxidoreductase [Nocardia sp. NPDC004415]